MAAALKSAASAVSHASSSATPAVNPALLPRLKGHLASQPIHIPPHVSISIIDRTSLTRPPPPPHPVDLRRKKHAQRGKISPGPPSTFPRQLTVKGPLGIQQFGLFPGIYVDTETDKQWASIKSTDDGSKKEHRARWGLTRAMLANMVLGVTQGFTTNLRLVGVGYRAAVEPSEKEQGGQRLRMKLGFSHDVVMDVPEGVEAEVPRPTEIVLKGTRKDVLGQFAADIRRWRRPEPYNGKGIFINDETIKLKNVKR